MGESTPIIVKCHINTLPSVAAGRIGGLPITMYGQCICSEESKRKQKIFRDLTSIDLNSSTFYKVTLFGEGEENVRCVVSFNEILAP